MARHSPALARHNSHSASARRRKDRSRNRLEHDFQTPQTTAVEPPAEPKQPAPSHAYLPGLDGMRALAVIAVLIYHANPAWLPGGFLGVDVFFVISGFIITRGLLQEWQARGTIDLGQFWLRRAKRLLPAVYLLLAVVIAYTAIARPTDLAALRADAGAAAAYIMNWHLVISSQSYFDSFARPSPLRHLWSLAVEEQFYLVWPILLSGALRLGRPRALAVVILLGALASAAAMALLYQPGADVSRIYYGTDTRAAGLLFGAALAFAMSPARMTTIRGWFLPRLLDLVGIGAIASLAALMYLVSETDAFLYRGGFALASLATGGLILAAVNHSTMVAWMLSFRPLRWLGVRSYGIYLWHWPVFILTWPHIASPYLIAAEMAAAVLIAALSYQLVEQPVRRGALERLWQVVCGWSQVGRMRQTTIFAGGTGVFSIAVSLVMVLAVAKPEPAPPYFASKSIRLISETSSEVSASSTISSASEEAAPLEAVAETPPASDPSPPASDVAGETTVPVASGSSAPPPPPPPVPVALAPVISARVTAVGDSVLLGAAPYLAALVPSIDIDATVGRPVSAAVAILRDRQATGAMGDVVVVSIGNNGTFTRQQFDEIMSITAGRRTVFVNLREPRSWEGPNNDVIAAGVSRYGNAILVDWYGATGSRPDLLWTDQIHLRPEGASYFAQLVASVLN